MSIFKYGNPLKNNNNRNKNNTNTTTKTQNLDGDAAAAELLTKLQKLTALPEQALQVVAEVEEEEEELEMFVKTLTDASNDPTDKTVQQQPHRQDNEYEKHFLPIAKDQELNSTFYDLKATPTTSKASTTTCSTPITSRSPSSLTSIVIPEEEDEVDIALNNTSNNDNNKSFISAKASSKLIVSDIETISEQPSNTSKNFENTFKLLQKHIDVTNEKTTNVLNQTANAALISTLSCSLRTLNANGAAQLDGPTCLELELEAMQRIRRIIMQLKVEHLTSKSSAAANVLNRESNVCDLATLTEATTMLVATKPLLAFYHDFVAKGQTKQSMATGAEECLLPTMMTNNCGEDVDSMACKDLVYHASKNMDGKNCLKVVRNLLTNKVLCGNRVSQMTRAYDDIEAVTRLLEEKEKDLELTVQIGKELLTQNNALEARISDLEIDLKSSNDDRAQLVHELHKKNELISVLTNDSDDGNDADTPTLSKSITLDLMQKKITSLQDENKSLKSEAAQLASKTDEVEEHERQLMADIGAQLSEANSQFGNISLDLERQREENRLQHEQIVSLTARLAEAEMRLHQLTNDNDEHLSLLNITKENQNALALELVEFKQRYEEVLALLHAAQDQLKQQRKKSQPQARSSFLGGFGPPGGMTGLGGSGLGSGMLQPESLQSELMGLSMYSENSLDSGISGDSQRSNDRISRLMSQLPGGVVGANSEIGAAGSMIGAAGISGGFPFKRVFDTVRCASKHGNYADSGNVSMSQLGAMSMSSTSGPRMSSIAYPAGSYYRGNTLGAKTLSSESLNSASDDGYPAQPSGVPGAPGAKELEAALKRLTPGEVLARRAMLSYAPAGTYNYDEPRTQAGLPMGIRTPDSIMSTGSSGMSLGHLSASMTTNQWRLPEKLQIVKPMEGSQTLHQWSRLATPTLSGLLEERPGVTIRGGRGLDELGMQVYTLSDVEEDVNEELPGKQFVAPGCTYTYTTSMVMHPDDGFVNDLSFLSQSQVSSRMASTSTSRQPSCPPTPPVGLSRKNSCSTFSVNLGLASMLNERGIKAVTPSALNTPAGPNYTPTVTPCNSPEGSPPRSQSPEPLFGLLSSGADLIRRKLVGFDSERPNRNQQQRKQQKIMLSRLERRALRSLKLVEKVESIGLENIITTQPAHLASGIANRSSSPLSQFSGSLRHLHAHSTASSSTNSIVDDLHFDRAQIKGVLHKGLKSPQTLSETLMCSSNISGCSSNTSAYSSDSGDEQVTAMAADSRSDHGDQEGLFMKVKPHQQQEEEEAAAKTTNRTAQQQATILAGAAAPTNAPVADTRIKQMQRQKSRRNLKNGMAAQRPDLGTIGATAAAAAAAGPVRSDLGKAPAVHTAAKVGRRSGKSASPSASSSSSAPDKDASEFRASQSMTQAFVGSVSSLLFGRKGGWL